MEDNIAYCDYIAYVIRQGLLKPDPEEMIGLIGQIQWDLNELGAFMSTKKTLEVTDMNGKEYVVTVEEK